MAIQYATDNMNYGQAKEIYNRWVSDGMIEPKTPEQALAVAMMLPIPKEIDLTPLVSSIGEGSVPEGYPTHG